MLLQFYYEYECPSYTFIGVSWTQIYADNIYRRAGHQLLNHFWHIGIIDLMQQNTWF